MQVQGADFESLLSMQRRRREAERSADDESQAVPVDRSERSSRSSGKSENDVVGALLHSYASSGLQASKFGEAQRLLTAALHSKNINNNNNATPGKNVTSAKEGDESRCSSIMNKKKKIYLAYTSNLISSGLREVFAVMVQAGHCDGIVTTAGGIEEDYIKCLGPTMLGEFALPGVGLREKGLNRVGNLLIPNNNYVEFDDFMTPTLKQIHQVQRESDWEICTGPSEIIQEIGLSLQRYSERRASDISAAVALPVEGAQPLQPVDTSYSVGYWCSQKEVPVFCPALTDGSIGDMMFFYNFSHPGMVVDPLVDVAKLHAHVAASRRDAEADAEAGAEADEDEVTLIVLGGGLPKHHLMRAVQHELLNGGSSQQQQKKKEKKKKPLKLRVINISTALNTDGSISAPSEVEDAAAGFMCTNSNSSDVEIQRVSMHADATLVFPLLYASAVSGVGL